MCGIAGILDNKAPAGSIERDLVRMCRLLDHRGPDGHGAHLFDGGGFGHTRLSILDLSDAGRQPMVSVDGRVSMSFNGEIYNYREIKETLKGLGYRFRSRTDSEVLLYAFHAWGHEAFAQLNGMFAAAFHDVDKGEVTLVRDPFGIKPLHVAQTADELRFSSEIKALAPAGHTSVNGQALTEYLYYGNALGDRTLYENIHRVLPGEYWTIDINSHAIRKARYWYSKGAPLASPSGFTGAVKQTRELLRAGVHRQLVSDVPLGIFLSGGVDSSAITAFASEQLGPKLNTFSVGFDFEGGVNELPQAARVAKQFGTRHHELRVSGYDLVDTVEALSQAFDEPFGDAANIPLFLLCKAVRGEVKVVLQGDGGDELFAGYRRYKTLRWAGLMRALGRTAAPFVARLPHSARQHRLHRYARALAAASPAQRMARMLTVDFPEAECSPLQVLSPEARALCREYDPFQRYNVVARGIEDTDPVQRMLLTDMNIILPDIFLEKVDRATMAQCMEVRVPFLDTQLAEYVMRLPTSIKMHRGRAKGLLRCALRGVVPDDILDRPKTGFGVPYGHWLRHGLHDMAHDAILGEHTRRWFDRRCVQRLLRQHQRGERNWDFLLWKCLQLGLWLKRNPISLET